MYLTKDTITFTADSTGNDTEYSKCFNGMVHSIVYRPTTDADTIWSDTGVLTLNIESATDNHIWNKTLGSTNMWRFYPRRGLADSTGVQMGNTTDYPVDRVALSNERIRCSLSLSTAAGLLAYLDIYVEGAGD